MTLEQTTVSMRFAKGVNTKSDPKQVPFDKLITLENRTFQVSSSLVKRFGFTALPTTTVSGGSFSGGSSLANFKSELVGIGQSGVFSLSTKISKWSASFGSFIPETVSFISARQSANNSTNQDSTTDGDMTLVAWEEATSGSTYVKYSFIDSATGVAIIEGATLPNGDFGVRPKCVRSGTNFFLIYHAPSGGDGTIKAVTIPKTTPASPTTTTLVSDSSTASTLCYEIGSAAVGFLLGYNTASGNIKVATFNTSFAVQASVTAITGKVALAMAVDSLGSDGTNWLVYAISTGLRGVVYNQALAATTIADKSIDNATDAQNIRNITFLPSTGIFYEINNTTGTVNNYIKCTSLASDGTVGSIFTTIRGVGLASRLLSGNGYTFLTASGGTAQPTYFYIQAGITSAQNYIVLAKFASQNGGGVTVSSGLPHLSSTGSAVAVSFLQRNLVTSIVGSLITQTGVYIATISGSTSIQSSEFQNNLHINGGFLAVYDGNGIVEQNFHLFPEAPTLSQTASGGSIAAGVYSYVTWFEWIDNQGQTQRSAPSLPTSITVAAGSTTVTVNCGTLRVTSKPSGTSTNAIRINIARTTAGGTVYYQTNIPSDYISNSVTADTVVYSDTKADATIIGQTQLYTTGSVVPNAPTPIPLVVTPFKDRLVVIPSDNPYTWWFSKELTQSVAVEFSAFFVQQMDQTGGPLYCAKQMDDKLIFFKYSNIFYVVGNGPSANGLNNDYSLAQIISSDTGSTNQNSIILTPMGLMFQSSGKGIYLLDRSLSVEYIGADVEAYNATTVNSAVLITTLNQVRFTLTTGVVLVYDYYFKQWSVFTNLSNAAYSAVNFQNLYTYLGNSGALQESTAYTDAGANIVTKVVTAWINLSELQGYQRLYEILVLGEWESSHSLIVSLAYDYVSTVIQTDTIPVTSALAGVYQFRIFPSRQKCEAIQITISESSSSGEGFRLSGLDFVIGKKKGLFKLPPTQAYG